MRLREEKHGGVPNIRTYVNIAARKTPGPDKFQRFLFAETTTRADLAGKIKSCARSRSMKMVGEMAPVVMLIISALLTSSPKNARC